MLKIEGWESLRNILCIRLDNLGDVIMTTPAFKALKENNSELKLTLLTSAVGGLIAKSIPEIDRIIAFETPWVKNNSPAAVSEVNQIIEKLRSENFDGAIIFTVFSQSPFPAAMLCFQAGIKRVAGYSRENPYQLMSDWIPDQEPLFLIQHEVERQLNLVEKLGFSAKDKNFSLRVTDTARDSLLEKLKALNISDAEDSIILHPGVSEHKRQFPVEIFAEAAKKISEERKIQFFLTGVASENGLTEYIRSQIKGKCYNLAGMLTMEELIALISKVKLVIANNTGPVHIAAAVATPVIVLYALTNPQHTPWNVPHKILPFDVAEDSRSNNVVITYAYNKCFTKEPEVITSDEIADAAFQLLSNNVEECEENKILEL